MTDKSELPDVPVYIVGHRMCCAWYMHTVIDLDEALRLVAERSARLAVIDELMAVDRDWTGILDDEEGPDAPRSAA